ncbi:hypothetical protein WJX75_006451 [Coccomyxa subellipsoidea]|uniref:CCHC-type domain-containing protein n=1 Tax=Coccomyxa subellipsoidea TaxID=248742 RepID=A0ABR2Z3Q5_9CHLO
MRQQQGAASLNIADAAPATSKRREQTGKKAMWRQPPRNVRLSYTRVNGKRVVKYRALLPLGNLLSPYRIGDFLNEEEAARAADCAILAFYGRDHPLAVTHFPKESYQEHKRVGKDLEAFLTDLSPVSLPASGPAHQRGNAERALARVAEDSSPCQRAAPDTAQSGASLDAPSGVKTPWPRASTKAGTAEAPASGRTALEAARSGALARRRRRPEGDRERRAGLEALEARLRRLRAEQRVAHRLDALAGAGEGDEWWDAMERRPRRVFEAAPPAEVDWNTRFTGRFADWARPRDSRFLTPHDYAADLRHAQRCKAAGVSVVLKREDERLCTCCGSAHHTAKNCPSRIYTMEHTEQQALSGKSKRGKEVAEGPAWAEQLRPELADVMRSLQQLSGAALASPGMKPFRHLLGSFSPDSLLALGLLTEEALLANLHRADSHGPLIVNSKTASPLIPCTNNRCRHSNSLTCQELRRLDSS